MMWRAYGWHLYATGWRRPRDVAPVVVLSPSTHIAAGAATSTTQRLTGLTGTFTAGRISDDTNALPSINIGNNGNTELEWCVKLTSSAPNGAVYEFRVTLNGVPIDTYSQTPQVTVGTGAPQEYPFASRNQQFEFDQDLEYASSEWRQDNLGVLPQFLTVGGHTILVGQVTETDSVFTISKIKTKIVGQVLENDTSQAITRVKTKVVNQVTEADSVFGISKIKTKLVNQITETDSAFSISKIKTKTVFQITETDLAQNITWNPKRRLVNMVTEYDTAFGITSGTSDKKSGVSILFINGVSIQSGAARTKRISLDD